MSSSVCRAIGRIGRRRLGGGNDAGGFSCRLSGGYDAAGRIFLMLQEKSGGTFGGLDHSDDWA